MFDVGVNVQIPYNYCKAFQVFPMQTAASQKFGNFKRFTIVVYLGTEMELGTSSPDFHLSVFLFLYYSIFCKYYISDPAYNSPYNTNSLIFHNQK